MTARTVLFVPFIVSLFTIGCWADRKDSSPVQPVKVEQPSDRYDIITRLDSILEQAWYDSALTGYLAAAKVYESAGDWRGNVLAKIGVGRTYGKMGKYEDARETLELVIGDARHSLDTTGLELASALSELGRIYIRQGKFNDAKDKIEKALILIRDSDESDARLEGRTYQALGLMQHLRGEYDRALDSYETSYEIFTRHLGTLSLSSTIPLNNIANIYYRKGNYNYALELHSRILSIRQQLFRYNHPDIATSLGNIGLLFHALGDYDRALLYHQKAVSIWTSVFGSAHPELAASYHNIGESLISLHRDKEAIRYLRRSTELKESLLGSNHPRTAISYSTLGEVLLRSHEYEKADSVLAKALDIWEKNSLTSRPSYWITLRNTGLLYSMSGDFERSKSLLRRAEKIIGEKPHPIAAAVLNDLSELTSADTHLKEKLDLINRAIIANVPSFAGRSFDVNPSIRSVLDDHELLRSLELKGEVWLSLSKSDEDGLNYKRQALSTLQRASLLVDRMREKLISPDSRAQLAGRSMDLYSDILKISLSIYELTHQARFLELAFGVADKRKSGFLSDLIGDFGDIDYSHISKSLLEDEKALRRQITHLRRELVEMKFIPQSDTLQQPLIEHDLFDVQREYESTIRSLEAGYPDYYALKHDIGPTPISLLRKRIVGPNEALVEYVLEPDTLIIFTLTDDDLTSVGVSIPPNMSEFVDSLRWGITEGYYAWYLEYAHKLHDLLLKPVSSAIGDKDLIIVPEGVISYVPFEALLTEPRNATPPNWPPYESLPYVIKDRAVSYAYSSTLLYQTLTKKREQTTKDFFALAPVFDESIKLDSNARRFLSINGRDTTASGNLVSYLPGSRDEVEGIEYLFSSATGLLGRLLYDDSIVLVGEEASEVALKNAPLNEFRYLHFATHSYANEDDPKLSGMLLLPEQGDNTEDGIFHAGEAYGLTLNAELVVLSACETGVGKLSAGEGLMGLSRGFLYAGAKSLVVSLWPSDDVGTKYLMLEFYQQILDGKSITEALRLAKLDLIARGGTIAKPYFWSPFIHIGD